MFEYSLIIAAGLLGGALNAIAGGGSFITLPALLLAGLSPITANATGTVALLPGYMASAWRFRHAIRTVPNSIWRYVVVAATGGLIGACILRFTGNNLFQQLIPWLMLVATLAFIGGPALQQKLQNHTGHNSFQQDGILLCICIYGGYFNGGVGIMLLAGLSIVTVASLHAMNGIKSLMSAILTLIASVVYVVSGLVDLTFLLTMSLAAVVGGHYGAALSYRIPQSLLRILIIAIGLIMTLLFFHDNGG
jgi:hypothetical protein